MTVTDKAWQSYIKKLSAINRKAAKIMQDWISVNGLDYPEELISYAYGIVDKYGEAAGALACEMYDTLARAQGKILPDAVPAEPATYSEVARAVIGTKKVRPGQVPDTVARLVKQTAADTTLQNAKRDGAQFAWIPHGDTCSFCITLASRGWQYMSKNALKNGHAEHIHANCDCEYGVRFDGKSNVAGYDPDKYLEQYNIAEGTNPQDKINSMRREQYAKDADKINARRRELYAEKKIDNVLKMAAQEGKKATIPSFMEGDFDDCHPLTISEEDRNTFSRIHEKVMESGYEYGEIITPSRVVPCESDLSGLVQMKTDGIDEYGLKLYHGHTNDTLPSEIDLFRLVWDEKVNEIGVVSRNKDVFRVYVGDGYIPTEEEYWNIVRKTGIEAERTVARNYDISTLTENELNYLYIRTKNIEIIHKLGWRVEGGKL